MLAHLLLEFPSMDLIHLGFYIVCVLSYSLIYLILFWSSGVVDNAYKVCEETGEGL